MLFIEVHCKPKTNKTKWEGKGREGNTEFNLPSILYVVPLFLNKAFAVPTGSIIMVSGLLKPIVDHWNICECEFF